MNIREERKLFERNKKIYDSVKVSYLGIDGYDVYNPSLPFEVNGRCYMFGRVESRDVWPIRL